MPDAALGPTPVEQTVAERILDEEEAVGALLLHPEWLEDVRAHVASRDFTDEALKQAFAGCCRLDVLSTQCLAEDLKMHRISHPPGSPGWITTLEEWKDQAFGLSKDGVIARAKAIHARANRRRIRDLFARMGSERSNGGDPATKLEEFQREADAIRQDNARGAGQTLRIINAGDLLGMDIPPRKYVLSPIFREKDLVMVFGARGVAKTWVVEGIATAIAFGGRFLEWQAEEAHQVLLIDGELPIETIQERIRVNCEAYDLTVTSNLRVLARDLQEPGSMPNLSTPEGQRRVEDLLGGVRVVILDNVSTLFVPVVGTENDAESWDSAQAFLLRLRSRGLTVVFAHHAGKSGSPRGTSKREDVLDTILELKRPKDYSPVQGARFDLHYTKARGALGQSVTPFEAWLQHDPTTGLPTWTLRGVEQATFEKVVSLFNDGLKQSEIASELDKDKGYISRLVGQARKEGRIK